MKIKEIRDLGIDELRVKERDLVDELFKLKIRHTTGAAGLPRGAEERPQGHRPHQNRHEAEGAAEIGMDERGNKRTIKGVVVSNKMDKTVVVKKRAARQAQGLPEVHAAAPEAQGP